MLTELTPTRRTRLLRQARWVSAAVRGGVVGAGSFLACMDVCFGLGVYSSHGFVQAAAIGAVSGAFVGALQETGRLRRLWLIALSGYGTAIGVTAVAAWLLSRIESVPDDYDSIVAFLSSAVMFSLASGLLSGALLTGLYPCAGSSDSQLRAGAAPGR